MAESNTVELERRDQKPMKDIHPTDQKHAYSKKILEWIAYQNREKKSDS